MSLTYQNPTVTVTVQAALTTYDQRYPNQGVTRARIEIKDHSGFLLPTSSTMPATLMWSHGPLPYGWIPALDLAMGHRLAHLIWDSIGDEILRRAQPIWELPFGEPTHPQES